jgi:hypothetical protein
VRGERAVDRGGTCRVVAWLARCSPEPMHDGRDQVGNQSIDPHSDDIDSEKPSKKHLDPAAALCGVTSSRVLLGMGDK